MESNHTARMRLDALLENCFFYISPMYEFLHSQGHFQTSRRTLSMVRFTPESCRDRRPSATAEKGRYCCKSPFALLIKNSPGRRRDFHVKMWGTSSPDRKSTGDLASAIENPNIDGRRPDGPLAGNLSPGNFRLLQQYRPTADP